MLTTLHEIEVAGAYCPLYGVSEEDYIHLDEAVDQLPRHRRLSCR